MVRRDKRDIVMDILTFCGDGKSKTRIMYRCNLGSSQCNAYVTMLKDSGFLELKDRSYFTTADGKKVLEGCRICHELTDRLWKGLKRVQKPTKYN